MINGTKFSLPPTEKTFLSKQANFKNKLIRSRWGDERVLGKNGIMPFRKFDANILGKKDFQSKIRFKRFLFKPAFLLARNWQAYLKHSGKNQLVFRST